MNLHVDIIIYSYFRRRVKILRINHFSIYHQKPYSLTHSENFSMENRFGKLAELPRIFFVWEEWVSRIDFQQEFFQIGRGLVTF